MKYDIEKIARQTGPVKDAEKKEHPCIVPYDQLPLDQRMKDYIFAGIVHAIWQAVKDREAQ